MKIFTAILGVVMPGKLATTAGRSPAFEIAFETDGLVPFPQVIVREGGREHLFKGGQIVARADGLYVASIPARLLPPGDYEVQIEGCRKADLHTAGAGDWIKAIRVLHVEASSEAVVRTSVAHANGPKIHFGIHKHMHQPFYRAADRGFWTGEQDEIFGQRAGAYSSFLGDAIQQYLGADLPHAGISASWSGTLIEQLERAGRDGLAGGRFKDWNEPLRAIAATRTALGNPRLDFTAFGFFHPLMALIPERNIIRQIELHREIVRRAFDADAARILFPPETAFHVRMIPALVAAGVEAVIYDSIHRYRACADYPYGGPNEGMLPPNRAEQENAPVHDWLQLNGVWAASRISPGLLRPEFVKYTDPAGLDHRIIAIPAERYIGNEDARGGFGALNYPHVFEQLHAALLASGSFDPRHPPFFLLHSDGDNYGGGADSYYRHNTAGLVRWLQDDPRFELTSIRDYLQRFPPDPARAVHLEPGSWSGADNGDPQFRKWFSRYDQPYSPDLNSWAVLTALQNAVHALQDARPDAPGLAEAERLMLTAETSCYWYWTGQDIWDRQVTDAANAAWSLIGSSLDGLADRTGPTIFPAWITPENPGQKQWGQGGLVDAPREGTLHTFIFDVGGLKRAEVVLRAGGEERRIVLQDRGDYPTRTGARVTARYLTAALPAGAGDVRYYLEAEDRAGNVSRGSLERVFLA